MLVTSIIKMSVCLATPFNQLFGQLWQRTCCYRTNQLTFGWRFTFRRYSRFQLLSPGYSVTAYENGDLQRRRRLIDLVQTVALLVSSFRHRFYGTPVV